jgi:inhibitor of cysteine peptidase
MRRMLSVATMTAALALIVGGCAGPRPPAEEPPTFDPNEPVSSDSPQPEPDERPQPGEGEIVTGMAGVESVEILILESFPVQVHVVARGHHSDDCTAVDQVTSEREGNTFTVTVSTVRRSDQACSEMPVPFEQSIPLDVYGLNAGDYTVVVNGVSGEFTLSTDNRIEEPPVSPGDADQEQAGGEGGDFIDLAHVTVVEVDTAGGAPEVLLGGWLPDSCTRLHGISEVREGDTISLTVESARPMDRACAQVIGEFERVYVLESVLEPGTYSLIVNGEIEVEFTIE